MKPSMGIFGLGSMGCLIAQALIDSGYEITIAVDSDPGKAGRDLGALIGRENRGVRVSESLDQTGRECDLFVHSTCSRLRDAFPQVSCILESGCNVISTCEELSYPYLRNRELSKRLDSTAEDNGVTILGTGVNPGFLLDALPVFLTATCTRVDSVRASRTVEASLRREPLQRKVGLGMDPDDFRTKTDRGEMGHIGLFESCALIASALGLELSEMRQDISPVIADEEVQTGFFSISPGQVRGLRQDLEGTAGEVLIRMDLEMSVGAKNPGDSVRIEGDPPVDLHIRNGLHGDRATVGRVLSSIEGVILSTEGLITVLDLPPSPRGAREQLFEKTSLTGTGRLL